MNVLFKGFAAIAVVGFLTGPVVANAGTASQGSDTTNYYGNTQEVCDNEADGFGVHGDFDFNYNKSSDRYDEVGGASSPCDTKNAGSNGIQGLFRHRTVEERPDLGNLDEKGPWHYH